MRIPRFVLLIIVNSDLQMTRPLYNFFLCIPFFWKLPETFGLGLIHTPILIKHSFDFPLFPSSLYQWFSYISGMMKKAGWELITKKQVVRNTICTIVLYLSSSKNDH